MNNVKNVMKVNDDYFKYVEPESEAGYKSCRDCMFYEIPACHNAREIHPCGSGAYQRATEEEYVLFRLRGPT